MHRLVLNEEIYEEVVLRAMPIAQRFLWIATADLKDMHVPRGKKYVTVLSVWADLIRDGVEIRLLHAKEPGPRFRKDFDRFPELMESERFERILCPRNHSKIILVDGTWAFVGSANLTGAGLGAKSPTRRNFEAGYLTDEREDIERLMEWYDSLYLGQHCAKCGRRDVCPDPIA
ncbi:MAG: phospholipase D-like domain-containing protein [Verrucomicrobiota bacterium]